MGKASLRLLGAYSAWSPAVREAVYSRDGAPDVAMLVRVDGAPLSDEAMAAARTDVKVLARLRHDHVLRMDFVSAVQGRIGQVYEHSGGAAVSRVFEAELQAGRPPPLRVSVEIAAGVAAALDEAGRIGHGPARVDHPGPEMEEILLERSGRSKLSGFVVVRGPLSRRRGFSPPEGGGGGSPAEMTWMAAQFLAALIRATRREGEVPAALTRAIQAAFVAEPSTRPAPGAFSKTLREIAAGMSGPSVRSWADAPVREALTAARTAEAATQRISPDSGRVAGQTVPPGPAPFGQSPTMVPDSDTEERALGLPGGTIVPEMGDLETEEPMVAPRSEPARETRPVQALPVAVGPRMPAPSPAPSPATRSAIAVQPASDTRRVPAVTWEQAPTEVDGSPPPPARRDLVTGPLIGQGAGPGIGQGPSMGAMSFGGAGLGGAGLGAAGPSFNGPSLGAGPGPSTGGPAPGPRRVAPMAGPRVDLAMDGPGIDLPEQDEPPPSRTGLYLGLAAVGVLSVVGLVVAAAAVFYYGPDETTEVIPPPPPGVEALVEPDPAAAVADPAAPAAGSTPAATATPAPATPSPAAATPAAAAPAPAPAAAAPAAATPKPAATPRAAPPVSSSPPEDEEPSRITGSSSRVTPVPTPAPEPVPVAAAPAAPEEPGPFDVSFRPAEGDITSLEVRCAGQMGSGAVVELNQVPKGTSCKITGLGPATPLQTLTTINAARSFTCFANGARSCR